MSAHSLSHVRFTPHVSWSDKKTKEVTLNMSEFQRYSRAERMIRDASRYMPLIGQSSILSSIFETKTILMKNEQDDGRPILFEKNVLYPNFFTILGSKIDNIYDILEKLNYESFQEL
jgi:hypothetical protein